MIHDIVIVGGGISGTYLSSLISRERHSLLIVEKSKSVGGRLCSKPVGAGIADYGCQVINPKSKQAITLTKKLFQNKLLRKSNIKELNDSFICRYGLSKIPKYLSLGVPTLNNTKITKIERKKGTWFLRSENHLIKSRIIVFTMPPQQISELLFQNNIKNKLIIPKVQYHSFYTITFSSSSVFKFSSSITEKNFAWIINNKKKGIFNLDNIYTVNTSEELTDKLLQTDSLERENIIKRKLSNFGFRNIEHQKSHFWKYAFTRKRSNLECSWNSNIGLGACGDGFGKGNIDGAISSANLLLNNIITYLDR